MNCPSCSTPLEPTARFCGVCGYRLQAKQPTGQPGAPVGAAPQQAIGSSPANRARTPAAGNPVRPAGGGQVAQGTPKQAPRAAPKVSRKSSDDIYIGQTLNNRFKVESKIGEGGFGAVYRGV